MLYLYVKAIHIIFVVTWFSGMFYLARLFIYNREAQDKPEPDKRILTEQFAIMSKRLLFGITLPSAVMTLIFGSWLFLLFPARPTWLYIKLFLVLLLYLYHYSLHVIYHQQKQQEFKYSSYQLRIWNEVPSLFLVAIVCLVIVRSNLSLLYGLVGLLLFTIILLLGIRIYKTFRSKGASLRK